MAHVTSVHYAIGTVSHLNHSNLFYLSDDNSSVDGSGGSCNFCTLRYRDRSASKSF